MGAMETLSGYLAPGAISALYQAAEELGSTGGVIGYNDTHTHAEVLNMFDLAISIAEARDAS